ncbi:MAG: DUF4349 domain-containing protein [Candidatus Shapirobacteria bacterium]|jgi:hypothetical protein
MKTILSFLKQHWAVIILVIIAINYFFGSQAGFANRIASSKYSSGSAIMMDTVSSYSPSYPAPIAEIAPTDTQNRLVIKDTSLSLQVKDVSQIIAKIEATTTSLGGFLVDSSISTPQGASSGSITVRVPAKSLAVALDTFRGLAVKVVSENVSGRDVTDQYVDNDARLAVLTATKTKFENIMNQANNVADLLNVQRELINLQSQIDSLKGQQLYLEKSAELSRVTIYLSTDELALPYAPSESWRPEVIAKQAIRSLVGNLRALGTSLIWLAIYSPIIIIAYLLFRFAKNKLKF